MSDGNGDSVKIPGWLWTGGVIALLMACLVAIGAWVTSDVRAANATNNAQSNTLVNHEVRLSNLENAIQRQDGKLDRIIDRLEK